VDHTRAVVILVPLENGLVEDRLDPKRKNLPLATNPNYQKLTITTYAKDGKAQKLTASLFVDSSHVHLYNELIDKPGRTKTRAGEVRDKHQAWLRGKADAKPLYDAVVLALNAGLVDDAVKFANELVAAADDGKAALDHDAKTLAATWKAVKPALDRPATANPMTERWKLRFGYKSAQAVGRYVILNDGSPAEEVDRRGKQLNDNLAAFYLWHATQGQALAVPDRALMAVLPLGTEKMFELQRQLDGLPMADGFYSPSHDLLVLSPGRLDEVGRSFASQTKELFKRTGVNGDLVLAGAIPELDATGTKKGAVHPDDVAHASTVALVERLANDEAEVAAVSREGTRQLLHAVGTLPRHVALPTWLSNGAVNFFARPRGPAYVVMGEDEKPHMHVAISPGYG
ncbi:MAG: hypothetical protein K2V38_25760, partial [Gemmataceae bacterium]|nr:hypothetical protein [Gemmataceae bacterium]